MIEHISVNLACSQCKAKNCLHLHRVKPSKALCLVSFVALLATLYALFTVGGTDPTLTLLGVIGVFSFWSSRKLIRLSCKECQKRTDLSTDDTKKLNSFFKSVKTTNQDDLMSELNQLDLQCLKMESAIENVWNCKSCSEENPGHFNICWNCDTTNDEIQSDLSEDDFASVAEPLVTNGILINEIRFNKNEKAAVLKKDIKK